MCSKELEDKVREIVKKYGRELRKLPNVVGYSLKPKKRIRKGVEVDEYVLRVYVSRKVPREKLKPSDIVPEEIEGVKTDVVEVGKLKKLQDTSKYRLRYRPTPCGVSTSRVDEVARGTIGYFLIDSDFKIYLISNNHVWARENDGKVGDDLVQPGLLDFGDPSRDVFAKLYDFIPLDFTGNPNYVDLAIAEPVSVEDIYHSIMDIGGITGLSDIYLKSSVTKIGATTGKTIGVVVDESASVDVEYSKGTAHFEDVVIIQGQGFVKAGDSGSPVIDGDRKFVGLVFAGNDNGSLGIACRWDRIVEEVGSKWGRNVTIPVINTYPPYMVREVVKRMYAPPSETLLSVLLLIISLIR